MEQHVLIPRDKIAQRVAELAWQISADLSPPRVADGNQITIVPILTGAMIFCSDLIRHMPLTMSIGLITVSSYPGATVRTTGSNLLDQRVGDLRDRHVLLVDDILDSGSTLGLVVPVLQQMKLASLKTCVLLRKDRPSARRVSVDYVGFDIPDQFVVGYGLDYDNMYRNLPDIVTLSDLENRP